MLAERPIREPIDGQRQPRSPPRAAAERHHHRLHRPASQTTTNSSPPKRATVSAGPHGRPQAARELDQHGVTGGVAVASLTCLKLSRSTNSTPVSRPSRADCASACSRRSRSSVRFGSPVSGIVERLVAHAVLVAAPRERGRERVRDGAHEAHLLVGELVLGQDQQIVVVADREPHSRLRGRPERGERSAAREPHLRRGDRQRGSASAPRPRRRDRRRRRRRARARPSPRRRAGGTRPLAVARRHDRSRAAAVQRSCRRRPTSSRRRTPIRRDAAPTPRSKSAAGARWRSTAACCAM